MTRDDQAKLEHSDVVLSNVHLEGDCLGDYCTVHRRSDHSMRSFPQHWRADRGIMERICPHGVGHPDPDDIALKGPYGKYEAVHGCDGCCKCKPATVLNPAWAELEEFVEELKEAGQPVDPRQDF